MLQVNNSNRPKVGLTALAVSLLTVVTVFFSGCKAKDPFVDPGKEEDPHWVVTVDDMTSSMTALVKVSLTQDKGTLAAFIGNDCCGIAEYKAEYGLYWLYISSASEDGVDVQLRFYSPELKRIFVAKETLPFRNDTNYGSVSQPFTPEWTVAE